MCNFYDKTPLYFKYYILKILSKYETISLRDLFDLIELTDDEINKYLLILEKHQYLSFNYKQKDNVLISITDTGNQRYKYLSFELFKEANKILEISRNFKVDMFNR
jgi:hypothetical protein